jgi:hypothetical protein
MSTTTDSHAATATRAIQTLPDGSTIRTFPPAPAGFDPEAASDGELAAYGYPRRPAEPHHREAWAHRVRGLRLIEPIFAPAAEPRPAPRLSRAAADRRSDHLAGVIVTSADDPVRDIEGHFMVPNVFPPMGGRADVWFSASTWIGVGDAEDASLVKLGCDCRCRLSGADGALERLVTPFWQWLPAGAFSIPNFAVTPGETLACLCIQEGSRAYFLLDNRSRAFAMAFDVSSPLRPAPLTGELAAFMVEAVSLPTPELASFGQVFFSDVTAYTRGSKRLDTAAGQRVAMISPDGAMIAAPKTWQPDVVGVVYQHN